MTMQLIDDIEQDVAINGESFRGPLLRENWDRIKAALLAGKEMAEIAPAVRNAPALWLAADRFRAATDGGKNATD